MQVQNNQKQPNVQKTSSFADQIEELKKLRVKVEVERDAKYWPLSVTFKMKNGGFTEEIKVTQYRAQPDWGLMENEDGAIVSKYKSIQGGLYYEIYKGIAGHSYQIYFKDEKLGEIREIIAKVDEEPKKQFVKALNLFGSSLMASINIGKNNEVAVDQIISNIGEYENPPSFSAVLSALKKAERILERTK